MEWRNDNGGWTTKTAIGEANDFNHKTVSKYLTDNRLPKRKVNKQKKKVSQILIKRIYLGFLKKVLLIV
ncbi:hypothetical protein [Priestia megaterium]|uniref:hypothetical protein n=1 Tax=Priestia megaterium TaxID=1404 RepID=UPI001E3E4BA3|nr:hypothetical protein [Priestia megaterium]